MKYASRLSIACNGTRNDRVSCFFRGPISTSGLYWIEQNYRIEYICVDADHIMTVGRDGSFIHKDHPLRWSDTIINSKPPNKSHAQCKRSRVCYSLVTASHNRRRTFLPQRQHRQHRLIDVRTHALGPKHTRRFRRAGIAQPASVVVLSLQFQRDTMTPLETTSNYLALAPSVHYVVCSLVACATRLQRPLPSNSIRSARRSNDPTANDTFGTKQR